MTRSDRPTVGNGDALRVALAWLAQPVSLACLALFILNDHVFKQAFGTWWTGKLSDVAGLVFAPALLAVAVAVLAPRARPRAVAAASLATVGLTFTLVKATTIGAATASAAWTAITGPSIVRADATDLLALPALALAWWALTRAEPRPASTRTVTRARALILVPLATLAVAATSADPPPTVDQVLAVDGHVWIGFSGGWGDRPWATSADGETFHWASRAEVADARIGTNWVPSVVSEDCVSFAPNVCYRVVPGRIEVERSDDGGLTWAWEWEVTHAEVIDLENELWYIDDPQTDLSSLALVVVEDGASYRVFVANARDGFASRAPDGTWTRTTIHSPRCCGDASRVGTGLPPPPANVSNAAFAPVAWAALGWSVTMLTLATMLRRPGRKGVFQYVLAFLVGGWGALELLMAAVEAQVRPTATWDPLALSGDTGYMSMMIVGWAAMGAGFWWAAVATTAPQRKGGWLRPFVWSTVVAVAILIAGFAVLNSQRSLWIPAVPAILAGGVALALGVASARRARSRVEAAEDEGVGPPRLSSWTPV